MWIISAAIFAVIVLVPLYFKAEAFPFFADNFISVFAFFTYVRMMFFVSSSMLSLHIGVKLFFLATAVPVTFMLIDRFNNFQTYLDNNGTMPFFGYLHDHQQISLELYLRNEMLLFGVGAIVSSVIFPIFLVISIWLYRNKGRHI